MRGHSGLACAAARDLDRLPAFVYDYADRERRLGSRSPPRTGRVGVSPQLSPSPLTTTAVGSSWEALSSSAATARALRHCRSLPSAPVSLRGSEGRRTLWPAEEELWPSPSAIDSGLGLVPFPEIPWRLSTPPVASRGFQARAPPPCDPRILFEVRASPSTAAAVSSTSSPRLVPRDGQWTWPTGRPAMASYASSPALRRQSLHAAFATTNPLPLQRSPSGLPRDLGGAHHIEESAPDHKFDSSVASTYESLKPCRSVMLVAAFSLFGGEASGLVAEARSLSAASPLPVLHASGVEEALATPNPISFQKGRAADGLSDSSLANTSSSWSARLANEPPRAPRRVAQVALARRSAEMAPSVAVLDANCAEEDYGTPGLVALRRCPNGVAWTSSARATSSTCDNSRAADASVARGAGQADSPMPSSEMLAADEQSLEALAYAITPTRTDEVARQVAALRPSVKRWCRRPCAKAEVSVVTPSEEPSAGAQSPTQTSPTAALHFSGAEEAEPTPQPVLPDCRGSCDFDFGQNVIREASANDGDSEGRGEPTRLYRELLQDAVLCEPARSSRGLLDDSDPFAEVLPPTASAENLLHETFPDAAQSPPLQSCLSLSPKRATSEQDSYASLPADVAFTPLNSQSASVTSTSNEERNRISAASMAKPRAEAMPASSSSGLGASRQRASPVPTAEASHVEASGQSATTVPVVPLAEPCARSVDSSPLRSSEGAEARSEATPNARTASCDCDREISAVAPRSHGRVTRSLTQNLGEYVDLRGYGEIGASEASNSSSTPMALKVSRLQGCAIKARAEDLTSVERRGGYTEMGVCESADPRDKPPGQAGPAEPCSLSPRPILCTGAASPQRRRSGRWAQTSIEQVRVERSSDQCHVNKPTDPLHIGKALDQILVEKSEGQCRVETRTARANDTTNKPSHIHSAKTPLHAKWDRAGTWPLKSDSGGHSICVASSPKSALRDLAAARSPSGPHESELRSGKRDATCSAATTAVDDAGGICFLPPGAGWAVGAKDPWTIDGRNIRDFACKLVHAAAARQILLAEVDRECRLQAEREVAKLGDLTAEHLRGCAAALVRPQSSGLGDAAPRENTGASAAKEATDGSGATAHEGLIDLHAAALDDTPPSPLMVHVRHPADASASAVRDCDLFAASDREALALSESICRSRSPSAGSQCSWGKMLSPETSKDRPSACDEERVVERALAPSSKPAEVVRAAVMIPIGRASVMRVDIGSPVAGPVDDCTGQANNFDISTPVERHSSSISPRRAMVPGTGDPPASPARSPRPATIVGIAPRPASPRIQVMDMPRIRSILRRRSSTPDAPITRANTYSFELPCGIGGSSFECSRDVARASTCPLRLVANASFQACADAASASPRRLVSASPRKSGLASPRQVVSASPRRLASASPRQVVLASPLRLGSASPRSTGSLPRAVASASPRRDDGAYITTLLAPPSAPCVVVMVSPQVASVSAASLAGSRATAWAPSSEAGGANLADAIDAANAAEAVASEVASRAVVAGVRFVWLAEAALQGHYVAAQVRALRMATRKHQRACHVARSERRRLADARTRECQATFALHDELEDLSLKVNLLRQRTAPSVGDPLANTIGGGGVNSTAWAHLKLPAPAMLHLEEAERARSSAVAAHAEAQAALDAKSLVCAAVLAALSHMLVPAALALEQGFPRSREDVLDAAVVVSKEPCGSTRLDDEEKDDNLSHQSSRRKSVPADDDDFVPKPQKPDHAAGDGELSMLRRWLESSAAFGRSAFCFQRSNSQSTSLLHWPAPPSGTSSTAPARKMPTDAIDAQPSDRELLQLLKGVLASQPKLLSASAPERMRREVDELVVAAKAGLSPLGWDASDLTPAEHSRILREGTAHGVVDPQRLAKFLGDESAADTREAFFDQWAQGWIPPYLVTRRDVFGLVPRSQRTGFVLLSREPQQKYFRQCGRVLVDGMRDVFSRAMILVDVEQQAVQRLLQDFVQALCSETEVRARFAQALLPEAERPKGCANLEDTVFCLAYQALIMNTTMHNPNNKGKKGMTQAQFAAQGRDLGVQPDFCNKMYDLIKAQPLGS